MNVIDDPHHSNCCDPEEDYNRGSRIHSGFTPTDRPTHSPNEANCVQVHLSSSVRDDYAANHKPCSADGNVASTNVSLSNSPKFVIEHEAIVK